MHSYNNIGKRFRRTRHLPTGGLRLSISKVGPGDIRFNFLGMCCVREGVYSMNMCVPKIVLLKNVKTKFSVLRLCPLIRLSLTFVFFSSSVTSVLIGRENKAWTISFNTLGQCWLINADTIFCLSSNRGWNKGVCERRVWSVCVYMFWTCLQVYMCVMR